jgi:NTE family protein
VHVLKVVDLQVRKLRREELIGSADPQQRRVAYWALNSNLDEYVAGGRQHDRDFAPLDVSEAGRSEMMAISTRLKALERPQQQRLVNWGYAGCDAAVRAYAVPGPRGIFPYPGGL